MNGPDALDSAAAGMAAQARRLDVIAGNLAHAAEPGYRLQRTVMTQFERDLMTAAVPVDGHGALRRTGEPTDLALLGDGYFALRTADGVRYTRDGRFVSDASGKLADAAGNPVLGNLGPLSFPRGAHIDADGRVLLGSTPIDRVRVVALPHGAVDERGYAAPGAVPQRSAAAVKAGYLEDSGVDVIGEMTSLVAAQRAYEANQKSAQRADESLRRAVTDVGAVRP